MTKAKKKKYKIMEKRRRDKNYFRKAAEGEPKPMPTDDNTVDRRTFSFFKLIDYIKQIIYLFGCRSEVEKIADLKIMRQIKRINDKTERLR